MRGAPGELAEEVCGGERDVREGLGGDYLAALDGHSSFVPRAAWLPIHLDSRGLKVDDPRRRDASLSIEWELRAVVFHGRGGDLDDAEHVCGPGSAVR